MRVGFVTYGDSDAGSGAGLYARKLADHLLAAGDEVERFPLPDRGYGRALWRNASRSLPRRVAEADLDVLLEDERCHPSLLALHRRVDLDGPVISIVHRLRSDASRPTWRGDLRRLIERRYLRGVDGFVFGSRAARASVAALADAEPSVVAYPAGDRFGDAPSVSAERVRERAREGPLRIVFVGELVPRAGVDALIAGLDRVSGEWRLTVVDDGGDPGYRDAVAHEVERRGIGDRVRFVGRPERDELAATLADGHLTAAPGDLGGFGAAVEGMGFGLPAVVAGGGADEIVEHRRNGLLIEPGDASAVTDAVAPLCRDRDRLAQMGVAALEASRDHPTWDETCGRVRGFLSATIADDRGDAYAVGAAAE